MKYYKVLCSGRSFHSGNYEYKKGEWTPRITNLIPCESGYHVCKARDLPFWIGPEIWEVEIDTSIPPIQEDNKTVACSVKLICKTAWNKEKMVAWAQACAARAAAIAANAANAANAAAAYAVATAAAAANAAAAAAYDAADAAADAAAHAAAAHAAANAVAARAAAIAAANTERQQQMEEILTQL